MHEQVHVVLFAVELPQLGLEAGADPLWQIRTSVENSGFPTYDSRTRTLHLAGPSGRGAAVDTRERTLLWETAPRVEGASTDAAAGPRAFLCEGAVTVMTPDGTVFSLDPAHPGRKSAPG